ncbi:pimeloyl-ACP methyl ester carboxylesterase [Pseudomonas sp. GGS8]|uniref:lipase family protein n=1 Tax=Pseudomonas sp. GGS8 TaxID=2817892 RepID=UPI00209E43F3|nr:lipase family protein [Pseudomonas sp. GGS8]MCP1446149.1 pimeloyl-ACP methyl ester carboxylesterase [Pseudomonas sp. GGS8]
MSDRQHRTDTICTYKAVQGDKQIRHWLEFQLLDERNDPLPHQPFRAINEATRCQLVPEFSGQSDAQGVIRLEGLHPLAVTLLLTANPLAEVLQTRRLSALRAELPVSPPLEIPYRYDPPPANFSSIEKQARSDGHGYHYLRIGQLCDRFPDLDPWSEQDKLPAFHFPDPNFGGFTVADDELNRRHVLEICPFRAWSLVLHHLPEYSMANAYNLGLMANLSYSVVAQNMLKQRPDTDPSTVSGSVDEFFFRQCLDLSRTPMMIDNKGDRLPALVVDVPFDQRYTTAVMLDSLTAERPPGGSDIPQRIIENTQLFYCINQTQVVVAWRGTQEPKDWLTDVMYRPMPADGSGCDLKSPGTHLIDVGSVHYGFLQAFEVAKKLFPTDFNDIQTALDDRKLFICGHSLGGALALIHSAELKDSNPLLYTYGMPRTFTGKALESLKSVTHFRHVNDADTVTSVPPEAALDNWLYEAFGPLGADLGYIWSVGELLAGKLIRFGDPYWHHGQIAMFYRADQHLESRASNNPFERSKEGLGAPYYSTITTRLLHRTRIYLVPSLNDESNRFARDEQKTLIRSLNRESLAHFFPPHTNPERSTARSSPSDHSMIKAYLPFLHNQLLELSDPERPLQRKEERAKFEEQMKTMGIPEVEKHRNEQFLTLQKLLPMTLRMTEDLEGGREALQRFCRKREFGVMIEITQA